MGERCGLIETETELRRICHLKLEFAVVVYRTEHSVANVPPIEPWAKKRAIIYLDGRSERRSKPFAVCQPNA